MAQRPGGEMSARPLHFIWIADCSGSMAGGKIGTLNFAIKEALPEMQKVGDENPNAQVFVRAIKFSDGAQWHVSQPTEVKDFRWLDLTAKGGTDMGRAMEEVAKVLKMPPMESRALPPVLVLLSDGQPTDNFSSGLNTLMSEPWGQKAVRLAIAIGGDADHDCLQKFIGHNERNPILAPDAPTLVKLIKWASTAVLKAASSPASQPKGAAIATGVPIPAPPPPTGGQGNAGGWVF